MKLNFSYRTELNCSELNWTVSNRTELFWTELNYFSLVSELLVMVQFFFFGLVQFSSSVQFLVFLPTP